MAWNQYGTERVTGTRTGSARGLQLPPPPRFPRHPPRNPPPRQGERSLRRKRARALRRGARRNRRCRWMTTATATGTQLGSWPRRRSVGELGRGDEGARDRDEEGLGFDTVKCEWRQGTALWEDDVRWASISSPAKIGLLFRKSHELSETPLSLVLVVH